MKFVLIGSSEIGKTSLAWRYKYDEFPEYLNSTIGIDVQIIKYPMFNHTIQVLLWDTAGQERFHALSPAFYRDSIGIFLCFDFGNRQSFLDIPKWMESMLMFIPENAKITLIGLKSDLKDKKVSMLEAKMFAKNHYINFFPVSAKTGENVGKIFTSMVEEIYTDYMNGKIIPKENLGGFRVEKPKKQRRYSCFWWQ